MTRYPSTPQKRIDRIIEQRIQTKTAGSDDVRKVLPAYAFPGGYDITYYDGDGNTLCRDCATEAIKQFIQDRNEGACQEDRYYYYDAIPQYEDIYWEGADMACDGCNEPIPSQYGDPFEEED